MRGAPPLGPIALAAWIVVSAGCASAGPRSTTVAAAACAQIFSTNDTHGRLLPAEQSWSEGRLVGGSAALAGYLAEVRQGDPACPVFVVSGGDIMQGTMISNLTDGASTIAAMNAIGYDVVSIGNHEFDWGVDVLEDRIAQAEFAMLSANIYLKGTDRHPDWVRPWTVVEKEGVRVGFIGMTTRSTPTTSMPANVAAFDFRSISEALDRYIPIVREQGVDFVVAVMHEGAYCDDGSCAGEALTELTRTTATYDYAVTGHTHSRVESNVRGAPVVQSFANTTAFGLGRIERGPSGGIDAELIEIRRTYVDETTPDPEIAQLVRGFNRDIEGLVGRVVMELDEPLIAPSRGDFPLGRLIADAQRAAVGADIALMNNGGVRRPLPAGEITYGMMFELQPFANTLYRLTVSGAQLLDALELSAEDRGIDLHVSGATVRYDPGAPLGSRVLGAVLDGGATVVPDGRYVVAVNNFVATGGGGYAMFLEAEEIERTGIVDLDALVDYVQALPRPAPIPREPRWVESSPP